MERVYQMKVVPDLVPSIRPDVDVRVNFETPMPDTPDVPRIPRPSSVSVLPKKLATELKDLEPGLFILPVQVGRL